MKRRSALQHIIIGATGVLLLPGCEIEPQIVYKNILIEKDQRKLLSDFTASLLPKGELPIVTPEPTQHFILNFINQCYAKEDIEKYMSGLKKTQMYLKEKYGKSFSNLSDEESTAFFQYIDSQEVGPEIKYFFSSTKDLAIKHFTTSETFMTEQLDYEMVPSRYLGCVNL